MLSRDVLRRIWPDLPEGREVTYGRAFILFLAAVTFAIVVWRPASIFTIASFSFSGYVMLVPTLYLGLTWSRFTASKAIASIVAGNAVLIAVFSLPSPPLGVQPVAWGLAAAVLAAVLWGSRR
jgi:SSS family solute:Na+ symporter